jgi:thioredoxin-related protein
MKTLAIVVIALLMIAMTVNWHTNFIKAKEEARKDHKYVLLNFSGSDWCIPCNRTKKEIFDSKSFNAFADTNLVLVNADFPRLKKNMLSMTQTKENEALAERYNKQGAFPLTILLDADGKILREWIGYPGIGPGTFIEQIKSVERRN